MPAFIDQIPNIDFLPPRYREATAQRHTIVWRSSVVAMFALVFVVAAVAQYSIKLSVSRELTRTNEQYNIAQQNMQRLARQQELLHRADASAGLLAYLHRSWPRTRLLAIVTEALPDAVTLHTLSIVQETPSMLAPAQDASETAPPSLAAERDLARLRREGDMQLTVVLIEGSTTDDVALHDYLGRLSKMSLLSAAVLTSIEKGKDNPALATFSARLLVRQPPGAGDGSTAPASPAGPIGRRHSPLESATAATRMPVLTGERR